MQGSYEVIIKNNRLQYKFTIHRNITILRGDSATGKTTLIEMVNDFCRDGKGSGIEVICRKKCVVLTRGKWERDLKDTKDSIVFIDEGNGFVSSKSFAHYVKNSDNYYVIATRESLFELPYSIREIYGIKNVAGNRYQGTKRLYSELYPLYNAEAFHGKPDKVIIEDSNSAYQFFREVCKKEKIICESAKGKSNVFQSVLDSTENKILVIADGAAFGPEIERAMSLKRTRNVVYFLPESFEWLILKSGLIKGNELQAILDNPSEFIESRKYFSWERFFTNLLVEETKDTPLAYQKRKLNPTYLHEKNQKIIVKKMEEVSGRAQK
ncbi:MAG: translation initiation factor 2 [Lachnospiraceae bacterium]|nr:translation initiation factor 2 [Lachnospiraceae bacterium]